MDEQYVSITNKGNRQARRGSEKSSRDYQTQATYYYLKSVAQGHEYLWQSLPRAIELWFKIIGMNPNADRNFEKIIQTFETYKIAHALEVLFSHANNKKTFNLVSKLVGKVAAEYPSHLAWWLLHFKFFDSPSSSGKGEKKTSFMEKAMSKDLRIDFFNSVTEKMISSQEKLPSSDSVFDKERAQHYEKFFGDLINLAMREVDNSQIGKPQMIPKALEEVGYEDLKIVMPIQVNLQPMLPEAKDDVKKFKCYNQSPVYIKKAVPTYDIMCSKEKPKKISFVGSDNQIYHFILKFDATGDMRKEARFISFANMINVMMNKIPEMREKCVKLCTYAIVPLSYKTGLIEWVPETLTVKNVIKNQWNLFALK